MQTAMRRDIRRDVEVEFSARLDIVRRENPTLEKRLMNYGDWARGRVVEMIAIKTPSLWLLPGEHDVDWDDDAPPEPKPVPIDIKDAEIIADVVCKPDFKREWRQILHLAYIAHHIPERLLSAKAKTDPNHFIQLLRQARREIERKA